MSTPGRTLRCLAVIVLALSIAGCATPRSPASGGSGLSAASPHRADVAAADRIARAIPAGNVSQRDVIAALGEAQVIRFDSGHEVWLYRMRADSSAVGAAAHGLMRGDSKLQQPVDEFVILFASSGAALKSRFRISPRNGG